MKKTNSLADLKDRGRGPAKPKPFDHYAELPKLVRVGGFDVRIKLMSEREANALKAYGQINLSTQVIRISEGLSAHRLGNTLLHETLHGIHEHYGLTDESEEEEFTRQGANGLHEVWRTNPNVMTFIARCFAQEPARG